MSSLRCFKPCLNPFQKIAREAILRRVVADGDDQRDHLTANVVLPLKENGVYTVHGIERERRKNNPKLLVWKFEYTVEDKRVSKPGQLVTGEKVCSSDFPSS